MLVKRPQRFVRAASCVSVFAAALVLSFAGCSGKLDDKECTKLKIESFDVLNKAQHCNNDTDCRGSFWPDCDKPLSNQNSEEVKKNADAYFNGKCEETKPECKDTTPIYCKQGLCVRKEKGAAEPGGAAPSDIVVQ